MSSDSDDADFPVQNTGINNLKKSGKKKSKSKTRKKREMTDRKSPQARK